MICATLLLAALPATAEDWKVGDSVSCEPAGWVRNCRFDKSRIGLSANVIITNGVTDRPVFFTWAEHHSACGVPGSYVHIEEMQVPKGGSVTVRLLDPGLSVTCRTVVLSNYYVKDDTGAKRWLGCDMNTIYAEAKTFIGNRQ